MESMGSDSESIVQKRKVGEELSRALWKWQKKVKVEGASVLMHVNFPSVLHPQLLTQDTMKSKSLFEPNMCFYSHELILLLYLSFYPKFIYILSL